METVKFEAFRAADTYKCGQFIESQLNDPAMRLFHAFNNALIRVLSLPFPHESKSHSHFVWAGGRTGDY